ncbi:TRAP transporter small permease [Herbaspirillum chlorophenolicum]|uniref:TRAP transporter small permease protein n=1 Tax=Herbaspirillum chlorophenolicum TaxID=211589 RepID=A0ABW8EW50_9BURK
MKISEAFHATLAGQPLPPQRGKGEPLPASMPDDDEAGARREAPVVWPARLLYRANQAALVAALAVVLAFTVGQVVDRYLLKSSFDTYDQFARIGLVWLTFLGIAAGIRDRANVRIELLNHFAPQRLRGVVNVVLDLCTLAVSVLLVVVGVRLMEVGSFQTIMGTAFSYDVMYLALLVGIGTLIAYLLLRLANRLTGGRFRLDPELEPEGEQDDHRA